MMNKTPMDAMDFAKTLLDLKYQEYGDQYKKGGRIMNAFFPNGIELKTEEDFLRYQIFSACVVKLNRYSQSLLNGGHIDSVSDLIAYAAILHSITLDVK